MLLVILLAVGLFFSSGCANVKETRSPGSPSQTVSASSQASSGQGDSVSLPPLQGPFTEKEARQTGMIFAKTEFLGVLKTRFVKLFFENLEDTAQNFELHIGEKAGQITLPWEVKNVKPGYFFIEVPKGSYRITTVTIPVGSTTAVEDVSIYLNVQPRTNVYLGTLRMTGTKEKIKFGDGLPVIKPGFEYELEIIDQHQEGLMAFRRRFPGDSGTVVVDLMKTQ